MLTVEQYNGTTTQANSAHRITAELSHLHHNTATVIVSLRPSARALLSYSKGRFKIVHYALVGRVEERLIVVICKYQNSH